MNWLSVVRLSGVPNDDWVVVNAWPRWRRGRSSTPCCGSARRTRSPPSPLLLLSSSSPLPLPLPLTSHQRVQGMPLSFYLLKPVKRVTEYPLLVEKLARATDPSHPDSSCLQVHLLSEKSSLPFFHLLPLLLRLHLPPPPASRKRSPGPGPSASRCLNELKKREKVCRLQ